MQHEAGHSEAGALSAGKYVYAFVYVFATEEELGKDVAQFGAYVTDGDAVQRAEYSFVLVQYFFLVLRVITNVYVMADAGFSAKGLQFSGHNAHERGFALTVASHQSDLLSTLDFYVCIPENDFLRISGGKALSLVYHVSRTGSRGELYGKADIVRFVYFQPVKLLQGFDTGLHLVGLGGLVTEGLDELLGLLYHPLLVLVCRSLLGDAFRPEYQIFAIRHLVVVNVPQHDFHGTVGYVVQELAVMRYQKQGAAPVLEVIFQPLDGFDVEVVGRFVQHQEVRPAKENLCQLDAHVPALAEGLCLAVQLVILETEATERLAGLYLRRLAVCDGEAVVQV